MADIHGVLLFDKPIGPTSHDIVLEARRVFRTRRIGHAGTLDPMASGLLVILLGEATKLSSVLTLAEKEYVTTVRFGVGTSTLDALGPVTRRREVDSTFPDPSALAAALQSERERTLQVPPQVSAIKVDGKRGHERARAGEEFELDPRDVRVHELELLDRGPAEVRLRLVVSKGYYVRALARDLGISLGAPAHLSELRRTRSGPFSALESSPVLTDCVPLPLAAAVTRSLPHIEVNRLEVDRLHAGKLLGLSSERGEAVRAAPTVAALFEGQLAALLEPVSPQVALHKLSWDEEDARDAGFSSWFKVQRGFR
jgi:tRNA pseudouridine55 synthase